MIFTPGPLRESHKILSKKSKDLLLERILQDLDTRISHRRAFIRAPLIRGITKILMQGPLREDLTRITTRSRKDLWDNFFRIFATSSHKDIYKTLFIRILQTSKTAPWNSCKIFRRIQKISLQDLRESARISTTPQRERSDAHKVSRGLGERYPISHWATTRAIRQAQSTEKGCATDITIRIAPQRERSDTDKVTGGLRDHMLDFLTKYCNTACTKKMNIEHVKNDVLPRFQMVSAPFVEVYNVYKVLRLPRKMRPRHPKSCTCHTESSSCPKSQMTTVSQNDFRPFQNVATKNCLRKTPLILTRACQRFRNLSKVPRVPRG